MGEHEMTTLGVKKGSFDEQSGARKCVWLILAVFTFLVLFYAGTALMSIMYPLDEALLAF